VNRQTKRMMQRQGQMEADGTAAVRRPPPPKARPAPSRTRTTPLDYLRDVRAELRKVAWPSRAEVANYSTVVFVTLVILISLIFLLNYAFGKGVLWLYHT
jgi:preprotein translocase subunit SecE